MVLNKVNNQTNQYANTRYVVDAVRGPYFTIQSAIDYAASVTGTADIFIRPGTYTEDLTYRGNQTLMADAGRVTIVGTGTAPAGGSLNFDGIQFQSTQYAIQAAGAGPEMHFWHCGFRITNGIAVYVPFSTGRIKMYDCYDYNSGTNGIIQSAGAVDIAACDLGAGGGTATMVLNGSGNSTIRTSVIRAAVSYQMDNMYISNCLFIGQVNPVTSTVTVMYNCTIQASAAIHFEHDSLGESTIQNCSFTGNPATYFVGGIGVGTVNINGCTFSRETNLYDPALTLTSNGITNSAYLSARNLNANSIAIVGANGVLDDIGSMTDGELMIGQTGGLPVAATLTAGSGVTITNGAGTIEIAAGGHPTTTSSFLAVQQIDLLNVTGSGTAFRVTFQTAEYNIGSNYNTGTGIYTAPVNGIYNFYAWVTAENLVLIAGLTESIAIENITQGRYYGFTTKDPTSTITTGNRTYSQVGAQLFCGAGDQICVVYTVNGMPGDTVDISGDVTNRITYFCGCLLAS